MALSTENLIISVGNGHFWFDFDLAKVGFTPDNWVEMVKFCRHNEIFSAMCSSSVDFGHEEGIADAHDHLATVFTIAADASYTL